MVRNIQRKRQIHIFYKQPLLSKLVAKTSGLKLAKKLLSNLISNPQPGYPHP